VSRILKNKEDIAKKWQLNDNPARKRQYTGKDADIKTALRHGLQAPEVAVC